MPMVHFMTVKAMMTIMSMLMTTMMKDRWFAVCVVLLNS